MKKILLTTSALTLLAGAAVADVDLSGYGRLGISSTGGTSSQYTRMRVNFSGSSTTDGGLTMTANSRWQTTGVATGVWAGPSMHVSNGAMGLSVGNTGGAISQTAGVFGCGAVMWGCSDLTDDRWGNNWVTRSSGGAGANVIRLDMALGGASVSVSGGNDNDTELAVSMPVGGGSVGIGYDTDTQSAKDAVEAADAATDSVSAKGAYVAGTDVVKKAAAVLVHPITHLNYSGSVGDLGVGIRVSQQNGVNAYMATVSAPAGGGSVYVYAGKQLSASDNYGIRYNQSLGGGASMHVGAASTAGTTTVGAGVQFGF